MSSSAPPYELGTPPPELAINWPAAPQITREVTVTTHDAALEAAATPGTRLNVQGAIDGPIDVTASDVEVVFAPGASAEVLWIASRLARVAVKGGSVEHVEMELPADYSNGPDFRAEWQTTDVLIDGIEVNAADTAFLMRSGVRIAIVNSQSVAERYSVWFGDTADFVAEDVILAGNDFESAGPEATVRLVNVVRSAVVDNRLTNGAKHNYRIHGRSDLNWASRNVLINSGVMLDTMEGDEIGTQWFEDNVFHHTTPSLLEIPLDIPSVTMRGNTIYSDVWSCLLCRDLPAGYTIEDNTMLPYEPAPPR